MKKIFYISLIIFLGWSVLFLKTDLFLKKHNCSTNIDIYYLNEFDDKQFCSNLNEMYKKIGDLSLNLEVFILPQWLYTVLTFKPQTIAYLNIFNKTIYIKENYRIDTKTEIDLFIKLYSIKNLIKMPLLSYISIPQWKLKGYALYIYDNYIGFTLNDFCQKLDNEEFIRFENKIVVKYLIEVKGYNEKRIFDDNLSYKYYLDEARFFYCK